MAKLLKRFLRNGTSFKCWEKKYLENDKREKNLNFQKKIFKIFAEKSSKNLAPFTKLQDLRV